MRLPAGVGVAVGEAAKEAPAGIGVPAMSYASSVRQLTADRRKGRCATNARPFLEPPDRLATVTIRSSSVRASVDVAPSQTRGNPPNGTLLWFWPILDPTVDRRDLRAEADLDLATICADRRLVPADAARYFVCRNAQDIAGLKFTARIPLRKLASLAAQMDDEFPVLAAVIPVRRLGEVAA